jgi:hypothetical protein
MLPTFNQESRKTSSSEEKKKSTHAVESLLPTYIVMHDIAILHAHYDMTPKI